MAKRRGTRRTNRRNTMRRRNTNRKVRRNTNRKVRRNTNRKVRRNTNRKVRRNSRRNFGGAVRPGAPESFMKEEPGASGASESLLTEEPGALLTRQSAKTDDDEFDQRRATSSFDGSARATQSRLIDINKSYLDMIRGYEYTNPDVLNTLVRRGRDPQILVTLQKFNRGESTPEELNKHLSKGSNSNPGIAKFLVATSENTPLSMIASYHLGSDRPKPPIGNTGKGVSFYVDSGESGPKWPDNKVLTALNAPIKPQYRQPKDFEEVEDGPKRPIAASYLVQRDGDQFVVADNRDSLYPSWDDIDKKNIFGTDGLKGDGPSQGPNCCWLGSHDWLINVFSADPELSETDAVQQVKNRVDTYLNILSQQVGRVFHEFMKNQISYARAGRLDLYDDETRACVGMVNGIPMQYKGNTNFKDNMEELFIKVCEKMDEMPPVTDKDLAKYGISYEAMCQSWTKDGLGKMANFSVPSPHSQILFMITDHRKLMGMVPDLMDKHIDLYISGFEAFKDCMKEFLYTKSFVFLGGNASSAVGLHRAELSDEDQLNVSLMLSDV